MPDLVDLNEVPLGTYISFTCNHPTDQTVYEGKLIGKSKYNMVKMIEGDLIPYHREVAKILTSMAPYTELTYVVIEYQQEDQTLTTARAIEWITPSSVKIINPVQSFDIRIYNREQGIDGQQVLDLLTAHGYVSGIVPK